MSKKLSFVFVLTFFLCSLAIGVNDQETITITSVVDVHDGAVIREAFKVVTTTTTGAVWQATVIDMSAVNSFDADGNYIETTYEGDRDVYSVDANGDIQFTHTEMASTTDTARSYDSLYSDPSATVIVY